MPKLWIGIATCLLLFLFIFVLNTFGFLAVFEFKAVTDSVVEPSLIEKPMQQASKPKEPTRLFGIATDSFLVINHRVKSGQSLSQILQDYNISTVQIKELKEKSKVIFNLQQIQANKPYTLLCRTDAAQTAQYFIYQPSSSQYVVFHLQDSLYVYKKEKEIQSLERTLAGTIQSSLYVAMAEAGCAPSLINHFADIYAWKVNFAAIQPGDRFKLIFEEQRLDGEVIGHGKVKAALFEHKGKALYAIYYGEGQMAGYYDEKGKSMNKTFLKEPLEYTRISSRFTKQRFHLVQKRYKAHLGTDFAAPHGTPIRSVSQGVVIAAGFTKGNGNFIKIQHDKTYSTQYLHMSRFAKGIKKGTSVSMGQAIGYVGSTGLASGPHLCYRFWKNGKQVDALREKLPAAYGIDKDDADNFKQVSQQMITQLDQVEEIQPILASHKREYRAGL